MITFLLMLLAQVFQGPKPVNWITETEHHFGVMAKGDTATHVFQFINTSLDTTSIDNIRTTCGCTAPDWSDALIAPGDTTDIYIRFEAKSVGNIKKTVKVYLHDIRQPEKLMIEAEVWAVK